MPKFFCLLAALLLLPQAHAADPPGQFDYWVLSLTWSPQFCFDRPREQQCIRGGYSFVVHGLWPENEKGRLENCTDVAHVDHDLMQRMLPLMPSTNLIQHEWRDHGSCSGMDVSTYFLNVERVHRSLVMPAAYQDVGDTLDTTVDEFKGEFIKSNPGLSAESIRMSCIGRFLSEVRICYDRDFKARECAEDIRDRCGSHVMLRPTR